MSSRRNSTPPLDPRGALVGAFVGLIFGGLFVAIGMLRFATSTIARGAGESLSTEDLPFLLAYVGAVALGGAFIGVVRPLLPRSRLAPFVIFGIAGVIVMNALAIGIDGWQRFDGTVFRWMTGLGFVFGAAVARGYLRER